MEQERLEVPQGDLGTFKPGLAWQGGKLPDGTRTVTMRCECNRICSLSQHTISPEGLVHPSVVCGHDCGFHRWVTLTGWAP